MHVLTKILLISSLLLIAAFKCSTLGDVEILKGNSKRQSILKKDAQGNILKEVLTENEIFDKYFCVIDKDMKTILKKLSDCNNN